MHTSTPIFEQIVCNSQVEINQILIHPCTFAPLCIIEHLIQPEQATSIIEYGERQGGWLPHQPNIVGEIGQESITISSENEILKTTLLRLSHVIPNWYTWSWKLLKYHTNGSKGFHTDMGAESYFPSPTCNQEKDVYHYCRQGSVVIYLNTIDTHVGGSTHYYDGKRHHFVQPSAGKCVIHPVIVLNPSDDIKNYKKTICVSDTGKVFFLYDARWMHEGTKLRQGEKYLLVGAMVDKRKCSPDDFVDGSCGY
jgi:hypothetical protein